MSPRIRPDRLLVALAVLAVTAWGAAQEAAPEGDDLPGPALQTASYGVFPVEGSSTSAQLQVSEMSGGGSRLVLSLGATADPNEPYRAAIYEGDCGPDRPIVLELSPVGIGGDPYVSTTDTEMAFDAITEGDHFVYLFGEDAIDRPEPEGLDAQPLACGEVGVGANR